MRAELRSRARMFARAFGDIEWISDPLELIFEGMVRDVAPPMNHNYVPRFMIPDWSKPFYGIIAPIWTDPTRDTSEGPQKPVQEPTKASWCTCGAKTPQGQHHAPGCPAREAVNR